MYDVLIIGAGITGGMIARNLSRYNLSVCIAEKEQDVAMGATKANSAIVHAGFDAKPGTLKAALNVSGAKMMEETAKALGVRYRKNGALVIAFTKEDEITLERLYNQGIENKVPNLKVIGQKELRKLEPEISDDAISALYAPESATVCPYELCLAAIGNAMDNGVSLVTGFEVTKIEKEENCFLIYSGDKIIKSRYIVNAAGVYSDVIAQMAGDCSFEITPRRGEYILLDKDSDEILSHTVFRTPTKMGKGILISPTPDGNIILGPTATDISDREDKSTTAEGFEVIKKEAAQDFKKIPFGKTITSFCGLRAVGSTGDFIINSPVSGFVNAAAIESPGLTASPAIAEKVVELLRTEGLVLEKKYNYNPLRESIHHFGNASDSEKNEMIKKDKRYGKIVCRCEGITEGEIVKAIHTNPKPTDTDGVKRRTRAQMGRCQGGFCTPYIIKILARELGIREDEVTKSGKKSYILTGRTKEDF